MGEFAYAGDLTGGSLMVRESRVIAGLLLDAATKEQWDQAILVDNLLQKRSSATARRNALAIRKRLEPLGSDFWQLLKEGDEQLSTQLAFYAALERNLLLVEFIEAVVRDAYITSAGKLEPYQWTDFLADRIQLDRSISNWKESSRKKMGQVVFRMLAEMGYLETTRNLKLQHVTIRQEIKAMLNKSHKNRIRDCMEVSYKGASQERTE